MKRKSLPVLRCNPILIVEKAKKETPELYQQLADEYYKTDISGPEFLEKYKGSALAKAVVQLR